MAVRIRLTRVGATKRPAYRVIAIDKRRSRDGRALEILGYYDPLTEPATLHLEREKIQAWIGKGAQPSDTVQKLLRQAEAKPAAEEPKPRRATRSATAKPSKKARAKAVAAEEAPPAAAAEDATTAESAPASADADVVTGAEADATEATADAGSTEAGAGEAVEPEKVDA